MASYFRPEIDSLPAYIAGKNPTDPEVIKVASNELPFPTLPGVSAAIASHLGDANRYPDMSNAALRAAIAAFYRVGADNVAVGNGSTALIEKFLVAVATPGAEVVIPWRSFEAYPIAIQVAGARAVKVPLAADGSPDLPALLDAITPRTRAILLCTPNNPTSGALTHTALREFLRAVPSRIPVLVDEAYVDFVEMPDPVRAVDLLHEFPNMITLRTFSKAYGLAGLRLGYALAAPEITTALNAVATPFGVSTIAQAAGIAALQEVAEVERRVGIVKRERANLVRALRALGWDGPEPQANFVWFDLGPATSHFTGLCAAEKIVVRPFAGEGVRVTVAEPEASLRLLRAYRRLRAEG